MKKLRLLFASIALACAIAVPVAITTGCKSPTTQKLAVQTLFTVHKTADAALDGYLDLVIKGLVATNGVPRVSKAYNDFQSAYNAAVVVVAMNTNATAPQAVLDAAVNLSTTITTVKKGQ